MSWMSYLELRKRQRVYYLYQYEVPEEHFVSLPLPTRRGGEPTYACFASPALRRPGKPLELDPPDRWWLIDASTGHLLIYTLTTISHFAPGASWSAVTVPPISRSLVEQKALVSDLENHLEVVSPLFFSGDPGSNVEKQALKSGLQEFIPAVLWPWFQALAPDFFGWLGE